MCNCKHSTSLGGEQYTGYCPVDASISVGEGWQTGQDEPYKSQDESYRTVPGSYRSTFHTPPQRIQPVVPHAPLRQRIARIPELAAGVAIVQRRLDFDDPTFDETEPDCGMNQSSYSMGRNLPRGIKTTPCKKCFKF